MLVVAVAGALVVAGGVVWYELRGSHSTPVSQAAAVSHFKQSQHGGWHGGPPAPGVYTYAVHGSECAGVAFVCVSRSLPSRAQVVVTRDGKLLTVEMDLSAQHLEAQRYRLTSAGRMLVWQRTRITILGVTRDDANNTVPPTLSQPAGLRPGLRWTQRFKDQALPVVSRNRVVRAGSEVVAGRRYRVYEISSVSVTGGAHPGTDREIDWYAPALGIDVRFSIDRRIGGTFPYRMSAAARLLTPSPRV
jgi:hypothetical protein